MTLGQFLETLGGKYRSYVYNFYFDGTPFEDQSIENIGEILEKECGFEKYGNEILYNGRTGDYNYLVNYLWDHVSIRD